MQFFEYADCQSVLMHAQKHIFPHLSLHSTHLPLLIRLLNICPHFSSIVVLFCKLELCETRSLGAFRAPTSIWSPFGPYDFILHTLWPKQMKSKSFQKISKSDSTKFGQKSTVINFQIMVIMVMIVINKVFSGYIHWPRLHQSSLSTDSLTHWRTSLLV